MQFKSKVYYSVLFIALLIVSFQNCSKVMHQEIQFSKFNPNLPDPGDCMFNGQVVKQGDSVESFLNSNVGFGQNCQSEKRTCQNGVLQGSYNFATCQVGGASACLFNGKTVQHGSSIETFLESSVSFGSNCKNEIRTCNNGILSGSYLYASCGIDTPKSCLFNGSTIPHGGVVKAFLQSSVPFGSNCTAADRTCNNGVLSGTNQFASCGVDTAKSCLFDGTTIPHGGIVKAYQQSSVPFGSTCTAADRTCNDGVLSGTYQYSSCSTGGGQSCLFNGSTIPSGGSVKAFEQAKVPYGKSCIIQDRTCTNGSLSGSYTNANCLVESPLGLLTGSSCIAKKNPIVLTKDTTILVRTNDEYQKSYNSNYLVQGDNLNIKIDSSYMSCIEVVGNGNNLIVSDEFQPSIGTQINILGHHNTLTLNPEVVKTSGDYNTLNLISKYDYSADTKDVVVNASLNINGNYSIVNFLSRAQGIDFVLKGDYFKINNHGFGLSNSKLSYSDLLFSIQGNNGSLIINQATA